MRSIRVWFALLLATGLASWWTAEVSSAADEVIVTSTTVSATKATGGGHSAEVEFINTGPKSTSQIPVNDGSCTVTNPSLEFLPRQGTKITLVLSGCFTSSSDPEVIDLDGASGALPPITVKAPEEVQSPWIALWLGVLVAGVGAAGFRVLAGIRHKDIRDKKVPSAGDAGHDIQEAWRSSAYREVQERVNVRWTALNYPEQLGWKAVLPPRTFEMADEVHGLEPKWSLKDSWMTTLTAVVSAAVAVVNSDSLYTALDEDKPKGPLAVLALAGLIGVALVTVATTVVKLIGGKEKANIVTVRGLVWSSSALCAAAFFEIAALAVAGIYALSPSDPVAIGLGVVAVGLAGLSFWYLDENLRSSLEGGVPPSGVPEIVLAEIEAWTPPAPAANDVEATANVEKKKLTEIRVKTALEPWLQPDGRSKVVIGEVWKPTGAGLYSAADDPAGVEVFVPATRPDRWRNPGSALA